MSEEKSSPIGIIVVVAVIAVVAAFFVGKSGGGNGDQAAGNQQQPTNGSDTNKTVQPPSPKKKENGSDTNQTTLPPEPPEPKYDFTKGLVAYYPFNGNAKDESDNDNDGEVTGAALAADRHGEDGNAYSFDSKDDFIVVPNSGTLDFGTKTTGWTISCWINCRGPNAFGNSGGCLVAKHWRDGSPRVDYRLAQAEKTADKTVFLMGISPANRADGGREGYNLSESPEGWHQIIVTVDMSQKVIRMFNNGKQFQSVKFQRKNPSRDGRMRIGNDFHGSGRSLWNGKIDDVRIYNRALSEEQVKALYDLEKPKE